MSQVSENKCDTQMSVHNLVPAAEDNIVMVSVSSGRSDVCSGVVLC